MMDSQEFGRRSSWILQGNINCHLEYSKNTACKFPDIISKCQRVLPEKKYWYLCCFHMFRKMLMTQIFKSYFIPVMSWNILKQKHLKMVHSDSQQTVQSAQQLSFWFTLFLCMFHPLHMAVNRQFVFDILMKLYVNII